MKKLLPLFLICLLLEIENVNAQFKNYVVNPSFEFIDSCSYYANNISVAKPWDTLKKGGGGGPDLFNRCSKWSLLNVPQNAGGYQLPRTGNSYFELALYPSVREYVQARLFDTLPNSKNFCITFYVNLCNNYSNATDGIGLYLDNGSLSTCSYCLASAFPQISNQQGNLLNDTLNWIKIQGNFNATGNETYINIGNFISDNFTNASVQGMHSAYNIDDVSVIESNSKIKADDDTIINKGDTITLGKSIEGMPVDWYDLHGNLLAASSTIKVSPTTTTSYVVKMDLCGNVSYDTVKVSVSTGVELLAFENGQLEVYPNPASQSLVISCKSVVNTIEVTNLLGQVCIIPPCKGGKGDLSIEISTLSNGIYFIKATDEKGNVMNAKFVKE